MFTADEYFCLCTIALLKHNIFQHCFLKGSVLSSGISAWKRFILSWKNVVYVRCIKNVSLKMGLFSRLVLKIIRKGYAVLYPTVCVKRIHSYSLPVFYPMI